MITHGQAAYEQFLAEFNVGLTRPWPWDELIETDKASWENIAAAAINNFNAAPQTPDL